MAGIGQGARGGEILGEQIAVQAMEVVDNGRGRVLGCMLEVGDELDELGRLAFKPEFFPEAFWMARVQLLQRLEALVQVVALEAILQQGHPMVPVSQKPGDDRDLHAVAEEFQGDIMTAGLGKPVGQARRQPVVWAVP